MQNTNFWSKSSSYNGFWTIFDSQGSFFKDKKKILKMKKRDSLSSRLKILENFAYIFKD